MIFFPFAKLRLLTSSEAFEAKGVMTKETKNAGIAEALLKAATASTCGVCVLTVGSATKATRAVGGGEREHGVPIKCHLALRLSPLPLIPW